MDHKHLSTYSASSNLYDITCASGKLTVTRKLDDSVASTENPRVVMGMMFALTLLETGEIGFPNGTYQTLDECLNDGINSLISDGVLVFTE